MELPQVITLFYVFRKVYDLNSANIATGATLSAITQKTTSIFA